MQINSRKSMIVEALTLFLEDVRMRSIANSPGGLYIDQRDKRPLVRCHTNTPKYSKINRNDWYAYGVIKKT